jgi:predicted nucleotidyltransferase
MVIQVPSSCMPTKVTVEYAKVMKMSEELNLTEIKKKLWKHMPELRRLYGIKSLKIFGSFVHNTQSKRSDIDLLVTFEKERSLTLFQFIRIENDLCRLLDHKVDLVEEDTLKPGIGSRILKEAIPV